MNMRQQKMKTAGEYKLSCEYLLHLMACALNGTAPERKPETITWEQIWELAAYSNVESVLWPAIKKLQPSQELDKRWEQAQNAVLFRQLQFDVEREQLLHKLGEAQIASLPLKGILLKDYYPEPGMRYMCDNDILYGIVEPDPAGGYRIKGDNEKEREANIHQAQKVLIQIMKTSGYKEEGLKGNHDAFIKAPIFNFEMHRDLVNTTSQAYGYYKNPWKRAIKDTAEGYSYHFKDEDTYIFILVHAYKHYSHGGCGIRTLADEYVFLKKKEPEMNKEYLRAELEKLQLTEFEGRLRLAAFHAFSPGEKMTKEDWKVVGYMLGSGTYGNLGNHVRNELKRKKENANGNMKSAKRQYIKERLWPEEELIKNWYPFFYRHRVLRIFLPLYRILKGLIVHPKKLWNEAKTIKKTDH